MRPLMVLGCTSDAGKSLIATALCRWFARHGLHAAPFKAQNMSNNARVVGDRPESGDPGGEIGVAQWLQARAARVEPDVRMNPVLLKPEADTQSQVIVRGRVDRELSALPWNFRHDALWEPMTSSFDSLRRQFDVIVMEGAGSPAEINLRDQVNNRMLEYADAAALLVSDIDRGGSFAHLFGTWSLVPDSTRDRLAGFVLNRFRGDPALLEPGPTRLTEMTGMAALGVVPMLDHDLPREEGAHLPGAPVAAGPGVPTVVLPRLPYGSNLDEFHLLPHTSHVVWSASPADVDALDPSADLIVIPGSKHVVADMTWLTTCGLADAIRRAAGRGVRVIGVCGGAMMLGRSFDDPDGVEGGRSTTGPVEMLGLLDLRTVMAGEKRVATTNVMLDADWWSTTGATERPGPNRFEGYEIRFGTIDGPAPVVGKGSAGPAAWASGPVAATTVHGCFEDPSMLGAITGASRSGRSLASVLDDTFEQLADAVEEHLDVEALMRLVSS